MQTSPIEEYPAGEGNEQEFVILRKSEFLALPKGKVHKKNKSSLIDFMSKQSPNESSNSPDREMHNYFKSKYTTESLDMRSDKTGSYNQRIL